MTQIPQYQHLTEKFLSDFRTHDKIPLQCARCNQEIWRRKGDLMSNVKHSKSTFCTSSCAASYQQELLGRGCTVISCAKCGKMVKKQTRELRNNQNSFCSRSCAAIFNNKRRIRPIPTDKNCARCTGPLTNRQCKYCPKCKNWRSEKVDHMTLEEVKYVKGPSSIEAKWAIVRGRARTIYKSEIELGCENCEYKKHAEVAHIKGITLFPLDTLVKYVNRPENILILCKRCHWEFDHNLLDEDAPIRIHLHKRQ